MEMITQATRSSDEILSARHLIDLRTRMNYLAIGDLKAMISLK